MAKNKIQAYFNTPDESPHQQSFKDIRTRPHYNREIKDGLVINQDEKRYVIDTNYFFDIMADKKPKREPVKILNPIEILARLQKFDRLSMDTTYTYIAHQIKRARCVALSLWVKQRDTSEDPAKFDLELALGIARFPTRTPVTAVVDFFNADFTPDRAVLLADAAVLLSGKSRNYVNQALKRNGYSHLIQTKFIDVEADLKAETEQKDLESRYDHVMTLYP